MKNIRHILTALVVALIVAMAAGTVVEKLHGADVASSRVYGAWWFVAVWALMALGMLVMLLRNQAWKRPVVAMLHGAILLILLGALLTMLTGQHGTMTLKPNVPNGQFHVDRHGNTRLVALPFNLILDRFEIKTYPGTQSPMDYVSYLRIDDQERHIHHDAVISMNNILRYRNYRFYQSSYNEEGDSVLSVAHDPWGIGFTYAGYGLLFCALVGLFLERRGSFRQLLRATGVKTAVVLLFLTVGLGFSASAAEKPRTIPRESASKMGEMYVMYKGRVCPLQTLAKDYTTKLFGKARYRGYTPEQVLAGWLFYYEDWRNEPMSKSKNERAANEKEQIVNMLNNGQLLKMFPHADSLQVITWYSQSDKLPLDIPEDEYLFIRKQLSLCKEYVVKGDFQALDEVFAKTKIYQERHANGNVPSRFRCRAEHLYNRLSAGRWLAMVTLALGLATFALVLARLAKGKKIYKSIKIITTIWMIALGVFLALLFVLRWIAGGHIPMAGSFDSMNLLALCLTIITLVVYKRHEMVLPAGLLMTGMVLLVQMMGGANPPVTQLMPVLSSPLLSLHVTVIMASYALLFFVMINGISAVAVRFTQPDNRTYLERLRNMSILMLYPAVSLLAMGIFIGAIWANISWGNYWSWDPKEVWALITLMIYAAPLHNKVWTSFRKPMFFHVYNIVAFLSVVITYFGVNLILGGIHAYN